LSQAKGELDQACSQFRKTLELAPDFEFAYRDLCFLLFQRGQLADARQVILQGIARNPHLANLHFYLGNLYCEERQFALAIASYEHALSIEPNQPDILANLGLAFLKQGLPEQAAPILQNAVALNPNMFNAYNNLGIAQRELEQLENAESAFRLALQINPNDADTHNNLGNTLRDLGHLDNAVVSFHAAIKIKPDYAEAHNNLGIALQSMGRLDDAITSFRRTLEIEPNHVMAHSNLGNVLQDLGKIDDAILCYQQALQINPNQADIHTNLGNVLTNVGRFDEAIASYRRALTIKPDSANAQSNLLFACNYLPGQVAATLLDEARHFNNIVRRHVRAYSDWSNIPDPGRCLRIGLVSGDLRNHPVGCFIESILCALASDSADRLEIIAYSSFSSADDMTERIRLHCDAWHSTMGLSDEDLAQQIRDDGIDILIDLSGHTAHNRLPMFAWKPAPVQVTWLGYFATTGVAAIDYLIADPWVLPVSEEVNFTETIWRLPETRLCFSPPHLEAPLAPLPALANGYITFGCFNNLAKMNDEVVALWARILQATPESRLYLKAKALDTTADARHATIRRFAAHGIGEARLILEGFSSREGCLTSYNKVDIALDPFPYTGGTTTVEALWMGVPVLTLTGNSFIARQGVGLLMNAGLADWVATDFDDYLERAIRHAGDLPRLATVRSVLRQRILSSPICDATRFAQHFDAALRAMWVQWCKQQQDTCSP
jgi:protein O-GlcNAc transferase